MKPGYQTLEKWLKTLDGQTVTILGPFLVLGDNVRLTSLVIDKMKGSQTTIAARKTAWVWHINFQCEVRCASKKYVFLSDTRLLVTPGTKFAVKKTTTYEQIRKRR